MSQEIEQNNTLGVEPHNPLDVSGNFEQPNTKNQDALAKDIIDSMTPQERIKFLLQFPEVSIVPSGKEITVKQNHPCFANQTTALEFHLMDDGKIVRAVLPHATFKLVHQHNDRYDLDEKGDIRMNSTYKPYANKLGGVLATREVNFALAKALIDKEKKGMLNPVDEEMLKIYRDLMVADKRGLLKIDGAKIVHENYLVGRDIRGAALYVLPLEQPIYSDLEKVPEPSEILLSVENLKNKTGVVIVGEKEADKAGVPIPEKYSVQALSAEDPYDSSKTMAQSYGLGFDAETKSWLLVRLSVIPGSLGLNRDQRMALPQYEVAGLKTCIPSTESESRACYRVMDAIVKSGQVNPLPLKGVYAATDCESVSGCRFIFGDSSAFGVGSINYHACLVNSFVGAFSLAN